jgi:predicted GIY-YIG superfamily endonuclease
MRPRLVRPAGYWTKERCAEVASRFETRSDFWRGMSGCYTQSCRKGWIDEICQHMVRQSNITQRWIYAIKSRDEMVAYIGLSWNVQQRLKAHKAQGNIAVLLSAPFDLEIISGPHSADEAVAAERAAIDAFKTAGWRLLNQARGGSLGGDRRLWTKARCADEAKKYATLFDFMTGSPMAYRVSCQMKWLHEVAGHLSRPSNPPNYWSKDRCAAAAKECETSPEFRRRFGIARQIAQRNGWMGEICAHMRITKRPNGYWNKSRCEEAARDFSTRGKFAVGCPAAYDAAWKRGWLGEICGHMTNKFEVSDGDEIDRRRLQDPDGQEDRQDHAGEGPWRSACQA